MWVLAVPRTPLNCFNSFVAQRRPALSVTRYAGTKISKVASAHNIRIASTKGVIKSGCQSGAGRVFSLSSFGGEGRGEEATHLNTTHS